MMELLNVVAAAVGSYVFGSIWYMSLSKAWVEASGVAVGEDGKPANASDPIPYIIGFICALLMAGMMRHVFALSDIDTIGKGLISGLGIGLFLACPWIATCYGFAGRSKRLILIDCGYVVFGSAIAGVILTLF